MMQRLLLVIAWETFTSPHKDGRLADQQIRFEWRASLLAAQSSDVTSDFIYTEVLDSRCRIDQFGSSHYC